MSATWQLRSLPTADGDMGVHVMAARAGAPALIFFMDAGGPRPTLLAMAARLAGHGYTVALPDLYHRAGPYPTVDAARVFGGDGAERDRMRAIAASATSATIERDTGEVLAMLEADGAPSIGCTGYCFGGRCALIAAGAYGPRLAAAASIHGARLATDAPDSPHLRAAAMRAEVYLAVAGHDPYFDDAERGRLAAALEAADVRHTIEVYPGVDHGFAVPDNPGHDRDADERHWERILALFARALR